MDPNVPGSSNAPASGDPFKRNPDGTVPDDMAKPPAPASQPGQPQPNQPSQPAQSEPQPSSDTTHTPHLPTPGQPQP